MEQANHAVALPVLAASKAALVAFTSIAGRQTDAGDIQVALIRCLAGDPSVSRRTPYSGGCR
jgi:hypothetical protein